MKEKCQISVLETGISNDNFYQSDIQSPVYLCYKIDIISLQKKKQYYIHL